jgi:hypothetical protein
VAASTVAIVVPLGARPELSSDEELSLRHLCHYLGRYDKYLVTPAGSRVVRDGFTIARFPRKFFGSLAAHNNLLFWAPFYRAFRRYEYLLIYHLDSLVFSDELMQWCEAGFDYIGPPWIPGPDTTWVTEARVGNGGFTLLRVASILRVLRNRHRREPLTCVSDLIARNSDRAAPLYRLLGRAQRAVPAFSLLSRILAHRDRWRNPALHSLNNDHFLSFRAADYLSTFRLAPVEQGLRFAFEASPRLCFELTHHQLPFGCHAWTKYDRAFWEPYLLRTEVEAR